MWREQEQGYIDEAGKLRKIPFEVMVRGDKVPVYSETLEDNGRFNEVPACNNGFMTSKMRSGCIGMHTSGGGGKQKGWLRTQTAAIAMLI